MSVTSHTIESDNLQSVEIEKRQFTALLLAAIAAAFVGGGTVQLIYLTGSIPVIGRFSEIRASE